MSKASSLSARIVRSAADASGASGAIEPLAAVGRLLPSGVTNASGGGPSHGPSTRASWPCRRSSRASPSTWACTPPGTVRLYGQTSPTREWPVRVWRGHGTSLPRGRPHLPDMRRRFAQVDVFTDVAYAGNPVAVVLDGDGVDDDQMQRVARWTNLSETTFVLPPSTDDADYRVRIFTPSLELPFAGHPTLGTCHAWLAGGGEPRDAGEVVQECAAGLVRVRRGERRLAFEAPPLRRSGPADQATVDRVAEAFGLEPSAIIAAEWVDNGPGWVALLLADAETVLAVEPSFVDLAVGLIGFRPAGSDTAIEVRGVLPVPWRAGRGSRDRQPQRRARAVADRVRPHRGALRRQPGHGPRPRRAGPRVRRRDRQRVGGRGHHRVRGAARSRSDAHHPSGATPAPPAVEATSIERFTSRSRRSARSCTAVRAAAVSAPVRSRSDARHRGSRAGARLG